MSEDENGPVVLEGIQGSDLVIPGEFTPAPENPPMVLPKNPTPVDLLSQALAQGLDPDTLQKFMDLQERYEAEKARKAYADAMAKCQKAMEPIVANAENDHTGSVYSKLGHINKQITPIYTKHGFSLSFGHGKPEREGEIRTTCRVLHKLGHYEDFFIDLPPDDVGSQGNRNKTPIHARASSNTYGQRYVVKGIFNLSLLDEDDDGNAAGGVANVISDDEAMDLAKRIMDAGLNQEAILREFGVKDLRSIPAKKAEKVKARIQQIVRARSQS